MALARVVSFEDVDEGRIGELKSRIESGDQPDDVPASEILLLHDQGNGKALAILFFDSEDDYSRGDATLNAMPGEETPGRRASVGKYDVAVRMTG